MCERRARQEAAYQFELQAKRLQYTIVARLPNFRYVLHDTAKDVQVHALVLASSFDYYTYRLQRSTMKLDLLLVQKHNSVVPLPVLAFPTSDLYSPGTAPHTSRESRIRRNHDEVLLVVAHVILGTTEGQHILHTMSTRTRQWYLQQARKYLTPKRGRPIAS